MWNEVVNKVIAAILTIAWAVSRKSEMEVREAYGRMKREIY